MTTEATGKSPEEAVKNFMEAVFQGDTNITDLIDRMAAPLVLPQQLDKFEQEMVALGKAHNRVRARARKILPLLEKLKDNPDAPRDGLVAMGKFQQTLENLLNGPDSPESFDFNEEVKDGS